MKEGRRNAGLSHFMQWLSQRSLCTKTCSFRSLDIDARSALFVVIGLIHEHPVSIGTTVPRQPLIKISIASGRHFNFNICPLLHCFDYGLGLDDMLLRVRLIRPFDFASRLAASMAEEGPQDRADDADDGQEDRCESHDQTPLRIASTRRTPRPFT